MLLHWQGWGLGAREWWGYQEWRHRMFSHVSESWVPLEDTLPILMPGPVESYLPGTQILKSCKVQVTCSQSCAWKGPVDSQKPILHLSRGALAARKSGAWLVRAARPPTSWRGARALGPVPVPSQGPPWVGRGGHAPQRAPLSVERTKVCTIPDLSTDFRSVSGPGAAPAGGRCSGNRARP